MALTAEQQELVDFAKRALPRWFKEPRDEEFLGAAATIHDGVLQRVRFWLSTQTKITTAEGATADEPDWLNQHANDRSTLRAGVETDPTLRARLRSFADALTPVALLEAVNNILSAAGFGPAFLVECPSDAGYFVSKSAPLATAQARGAFYYDPVNDPDGFADRMCGPTPPTAIFILPFGTSASVQTSIENALEQKRGAGVRILIEVRAIP